MCSCRNKTANKTAKKALKSVPRKQTPIKFSNTPKVTLKKQSRKIVVPTGTPIGGTTKIKLPTK